MLPKRHILTFLTFCCFLSIQATAQRKEANLSEANVPAYTLPDPLRTKDGKVITTAQQWTQIQRPYIYHLFEEHVYGRFPRKALSMTYKVNRVDPYALDSTATCKQITLYFTKSDTLAQLHLLLYLPNKPKRRVPVFLGMNFYGNQSVINDPSIPITTGYTVKGPGIVDNRATEASRGAQASQWPIKDIISRGYGLATFFYGDVEADKPDGWQTGFRTRLQELLDIRPEEWSAMGVWAWALCRALDYLEMDKRVDPDQVLVMGHSRLGKAALWAGASDPRFAMVISNESGEGGAALSRRDYGENIELITRSFPHWFVADYKNYGSNPAALPVDQHMLLALIAPRPLYVASAEGDQWSDPKGEFLSARYAEPVYLLFGKRGLGTDTFPRPQQPTGEFIRYHIRTGKHDVTAYDWEQYLQFAGKHCDSRP
ncbi:acetylxylan esterase [Chitinophaga agrisoli]|uniref:Acetylxylan esterase n=2 Tax=Chitinophaga agrisoli TaxID=2607653 RepID=A0A5B2W573_9BACT|nr:acetylxylan esterase [Chitinophaga agrisoli]